MEAAYLHDLHTEGLQPGQEPVQRGLIPQWAVQDRLDRLHRGADPLEVKERFGRQDPDDADFIVRRRQQSPPAYGDGHGPKDLTFSRPGVRRAMHHG
jgi:hypothetical protein